MIPALRTEDVRRTEAAALAALPPGTLMQRAASALAVACADVLRESTGGVTGRTVVVLAGPGDNGGDALFAAARLARRGVAVTALLTADRVHDEALADAHRAGVRSRAWRAGDEDVCAAADLLLDGIAGIGGRGGLRPAFEGLSALDGPAVVAVDLPSGLDADTGAVTGEVLAADLTVTFGTAKPVHLLGPAAALCGRLLVADIGLTDLPAAAVERVEPADVAARWRRPRPSDDKYSRGVVGVVAGGPDYTGAAVLAVEAAVRAGAGMVRYVGPAHPTELVRHARPEVVAGPGACRRGSWARGVPGRPRAAGPRPGGPGGRRTGRRRRRGARGPARARAAARAHPARRGAGAPPRDGTVRRGGRPAHPRPPRPRGDGRDRPAQGTVTTVVGARVLTAAAAPAWLATAGAGDVLAGILGTALAGLRDPRDPEAVAFAAADAAVLHGRAAALASAGGPLAALDVAQAVPAALTSLPGWDAP